MAKLIRVRLAIAFMVAVLVGAGCGKSGSDENGDDGGSGIAEAPSTDSGELIVANFQPFTGEHALFGQLGSVLCAAAEKAVNDAGGILGNTIKCENFDSTSSPANAVPNARRMIATNDNIVVVYGPAGPSISSTSVFAEVGLVHQLDGGASELDCQTSPYFLRYPPSDAVEGPAVALYALDQGFTKAATLFSSDLSAQGIAPDIIETFNAEGGEVVEEVSVTNGASSYRTEAAALLESEPEVIISELEPKTAATFYSDLTALADGEIPPVILTNRAGQPDWISAMEQAIGQEGMDAFTLINVRLAEGPGLEHYAKLVSEAPYPDDPDFLPVEEFPNDSYNRWGYDGIILAALAIAEAESLDPDDWAELQVTIANPREGATEVHTYEEGLAALEAGEKIRYVGASGPATFNEYHNAFFSYSESSWDGDTFEISEPDVVTAEQLSDFVGDRCS